MGDPARPQSLVGGSKSRPLSNNLTCLARVPSVSATGLRNGLLADAASLATTSPTGMHTPEPSVPPRSAFNDCLSAIGLPGEEEATFEPLIIEPYEPSPSDTPSPTTAAAPTTTAEGAGVDPPLSPLTRPAAAPPPPTSLPSPTAATPIGTVIAPKPPPGSALKRFASSRRSVAQQASHVSTAAAASGGGGGPALPAAPHTPLAAAADAPPLIPPLPVIALGEVPIVMFNPTAIPMTSVAAAAGGGADGRASSSFLDPAKPAVRRLLPPLLHASQAIQDTAAGDVSPTARDEGASAGCGSGMGFSPRMGSSPSRCGSSAAMGYSSASSPAGGLGRGGGSCGNLDVWAELQEALAAPAEALAVPLMCIDLYDTSSPRGRRALPPMDPLRTSAAALSLSAVSTSEAALTAAEELASTPSAPLSYSVLSPRQADVAAARRGPPSVRSLPWDTEGPNRELRESSTWVGGAAGEAGEFAAGGFDGANGVGDGGSTAGGIGGLVQRTGSLHTVVGGGSGSSGYAGGQLFLTQRARSLMTPPDASRMALSYGGSADTGGCGAGGGGGSSSGGDGGAAAGRNLGRICRTSSLGKGTARMANAAAALVAASVTAALPPIADRGGSARRQTATNC